MIKVYENVFRFFECLRKHHQSENNGLSFGEVLELTWVDFNTQTTCAFSTEPELKCAITQRSGVIWVPDPLHLQSLQEEWGRQLPHQVNRQGIGLKDEMNWVSSYRAKGFQESHGYVDISPLTFPISGDHVTEI